MKSLFWRSILITIFATLLAAQVVAQDSGDPTALNKLLSDGEQEVTASELLLDVPFDSKTQWETYKDKEITLAIANGVYQMKLKGNISTVGLNYESQTDTVIQVKTKQISKDNNSAYGVMCRADANASGDGYYFLISGDGLYTITKVDGDATSLVDWTESKAINQGQDENEITAVCVKNYLAMYVNDVLVAETSDDTFTKGDPGFSLSGYADDADLEVHFDDARIWSASMSKGTTLSNKPSTAADLPESLTSYDGKPKEAIAELEQLGVIPSGSSMIFNENYAFFTGQGNWFTPLASRAPHKNIVMAGELTFTVGSSSDFESCLLTGRIEKNDKGDATTFIDVGLGNDGLAYIYDRFSEEQDGTSEVGTTKLDLKQPHHLLFTMINDRANVYVDGTLEISNFEIVQRSGTYGISLIGRGPKARCEGRNLWVFSVPSVKPGECAVSSTRAANKRTGPGTTFDAAGQMTAGDEVLVSGQSKGADGKNWWQLEDETWVREDLVTEVGDCANVPIVKQ